MTNKPKNEGKHVIIEGEESGVTPSVGSGPPYWGEGPNLTFLKSRSTHYFYKNTVEVPKWRFFCSVFFTLSEPIWVGDLGTGKTFFIN